MSSLTMGESNSVTINGEYNYFRIYVEAGKDLMIKCNFNIPGKAAFYISYAAMPTPTEYDFHYKNLNDLLQQLSIPGTREGWYYVLIHNLQPESDPYDISIEPELLNFEIRSVSPSLGSNNGETTLTIHGSKFGPDAKLNLIGPDTIPAKKVWFQSSETLFATFNLNGAATGKYDVQLEVKGEITSANNAFNVFSGTKGSVKVRLSVPDAVRPASGMRQNAAIIFYENEGDTDVLAPLIVLSAENAELRPPGYDEFIEGPYAFLGINEEGPAGILPPGAKGIIYINFAPTIANGDIDWGLGVIDPETPLGWETLKEACRPGNIQDDTWEVVWKNFTEAIGSNYGSLQSVLCDNANYLSQLGYYVSDYSRLLNFELEKANCSFVNESISDSLDIEEATPGKIPFVFERTYHHPLIQRYQKGDMGRAWTHNWDYCIKEAGDVVQVFKGGKLIYIFTKNEEDNYINQYTYLNDEVQLYKNSTGYSLTLSDGSSQIFDANGFLCNMEDNNKNVVSIIRNGVFIDKIIHSCGQSFDFTHDSNGRIIQITSSSGRTVTYSYDGAGELLTDVETDIDKTSYSYGDNYQLATILNPKENTEFIYDSKSRILEIYKNDDDSPVRFGYGGGAEILITDQSVAMTTFFYDDNFRLCVVINSTGQVARSSYDQNGNVTTLDLPMPLRNNFKYDDSGNMVNFTDPLGRNFSFSYSGNVLNGFSDPKGNMMSFTSDSGRNLQNITYPDGTSEKFEYNLQGLPIAKENRRGQKLSFQFNENGQMIQKSSPDNGEVNFGYDEKSNFISATDSKGVIDIEYNDDDKITKVTYPNGRFLSYTYDSDTGRKTSISDQNEFTVKYIYDSNGRLSQIVDITGLALVTYFYDLVGRPVKKIKGNGTSTTFEYTTTGFISKIVNYDPDNSINSKIEYLYDSLGRRISMSTLDGIWKYTYDVTEQLVNAQFTSNNPAMTDQDIKYVYDACGNRRQVIRNEQKSGFHHERNESTFICRKYFI